MNRSISDSCSSLRSNSDRDAIDLTILGSPAPRVSKVNRAAPRRPLQPPNSPTRPLNLPIDQIMRLRAELNQRLEEGCGFTSDRASSLSPTSSHPELAIDLSSIADSLSESAISSATSSCDESEWSPIRPHQHRTSTAQYTPYTSPYAQSRIIRPKFHGKTPQSNYVTPTISLRTGPRVDGSCHSRCSCRTHTIDRVTERKSTGQSADLIQVYVDTVNNAQLSKFFRPCVSCDKQCCECSRFESFQSTELPSHRGTWNETCKTCCLQYCACFPLPSSVKVHSRGQSSHSSDTSRCASHRRVKNIGEQAADSGNSTLQLDDSNRETMPVNTQISERFQEDLTPSRDENPSGIISRDHVSLSVMQLATAAQCARILADSLESVLQLARNEIAEGSENASFNGSTVRTDSLQSAFQSLTDKNTK